MNISKEESDYKYFHRISSTRVHHINNTIYSNLPSSIERIFNNENIPVVLALGILIIFIVPAILVFVIFLAYKKRKFNLQSNYTEFDDILGSNTDTIIKRIRRIQSNGTIKNIGNQSLSKSSIRSNSIKNSRNVDSNKKQTTKRVSKVSILFKDDNINENTNL